MKGPQILTGVGCLLFGLAFLFLLVSALAPVVNAPRTSFSEAMPFIIAAGGCSCVSFLLLAGGIVWWIVARKKEPEA